MLISKSELALSSKHALETTTLSQLRLAGEPRADSAFAKLLDSKMQSPPAQLLTVDAAATSSAQRERSPFEAIMEMLFDVTRRPDTLPSLEGMPDQKGQQGGGFQVAQLVHRRETESCSFAASGKVCLADGSERQFDVAYQMERSEESTSMSIGVFRDPLMLDFAQPQTRLNQHSVDFDLDSDGQTESMRMPTAEAAVLFLDRNRNGVADNGSELFGPQSGDGFADLAKLDGDDNGWIDGGDASYADLKLWHLTDDGVSSVRSLAEAGIGALATASTATPFTLKENGESVGQVRASSVWLGEKGGAGSVRQVDVTTTPHTQNA